MTATSNAALDPEAEIAAFDRIRRLAAPDRAVVLVTHRMSGVRRADRIHVLSHGRLVAVRVLDGPAALSPDGAAGGGPARYASGSPAFWTILAIQAIASGTS
ncbi:hypothetical protein [Streptomyces fumanus]|uniref:hypothetical protein n=1 Tax=Streptomyces fumanus TaxID=67302 RepID=UPI003405987C